PTEAAAITAHLRMQQKKWPDAATAFEEVLAAFSHYPWTPADMVERTLVAANELAHRNEGTALAMERAFSKPFVICDHDDFRIRLLLAIGTLLDRGNFGGHTLAGIEAMEPNVPWEGDFLRVREECYLRLNDPRFAQAHRDYVAFTKAAPVSIANMKVQRADDVARLSQAVAPDPFK
ncbi:MAG: hypothetical protein ACREIW_08870, partial [Chthoniobacterales bacterium]